MQLFSLITTYKSTGRFVALQLLGTLKHNGATQRFLRLLSDSKGKVRIQLQEYRNGTLIVRRLYAVRLNRLQTGRKVLQVKLPVMGPIQAHLPPVDFMVRQQLIAIVQLKTRNIYDDIRTRHKH